jgi:hypothetical protein
MELILAMRFVSDTVLIMVHFMSCFLKFLDFGRNPPTHSPFYFLWLFVTCCFPPSSPSVSSLQNFSVTQADPSTYCCLPVAQVPVTPLTATGAELAGPYV